MRKSVMLLLLPYASVLASPVHAQTEPQGVMEGDRVRLSATTVQGVFVVAALSSDTLVLRGTTPAVEPVMLPLNSITTLEVRRARSRGAGALRGAGVGFLAGAGGGAIWGLTLIDRRPDAWFSPAETVLGFGGVLGGAGAVVGGLVGLSFPRERWERVDLHQRLGFSRGCDGAPWLTYSYRF
jgi:hypothetical protein